MFRYLLATVAGRLRPDTLMVHCRHWTECSAKISLRSSINIIRAVRILWRNFIRPGSMCGDSAIRQSTINALPSNSIGCWDKAYPLVCICSTEEQISGTWMVPIRLEDIVRSPPAMIMTRLWVNGETVTRNIMLSGKSFRSICLMEPYCPRFPPTIRQQPSQRLNWKKVLLCRLLFTRLPNRKMSFQWKIWESTSVTYTIRLP